MKIGMFTKSWNLAEKNNSILLFSNLILSCVCLGLAFKVFGNHERITLVPPELNAEAKIGWNEANENYYRGIANYIAVSIGSMTPKNADFIVSVLSQFFHPDIYASVRSKLLSVKEGENGGINAFAVFAPGAIFYETDKKGKMNRVFVIGELRSSLGNVFTEAGKKIGDDVKDVVYEMDFVTQNGRPLVIRLDSYVGRDPRTQKFLLTRPAIAAEIEKKRLARQKMADDLMTAKKAESATDGAEAGNASGILSGPVIDGSQSK